MSILEDERKLHGHGKDDPSSTGDNFFEKNAGDKMDNSKKASPSVSLILKKISDDKTLDLLDRLAIPSKTQDISPKIINLSAKQYYSRISGLQNAGLIKRNKGKYSLTLLGKVVYESRLTIEKALAYYWKLKAIDSVETATWNQRSDEMIQLINALIDDQKIKENLMKPIHVHSNNKNIPIPM